MDGDLGAVWRESMELCRGRLRSCVEGDLGAVWGRLRNSVEGDIGTMWRET